MVDAIRKDAPSGSSSSTSLINKGKEAYHRLAECILQSLRLGMSSKSEVGDEDCNFNKNGISRSHNYLDTVAYLTARDSRFFLFYIKVEDENLMKYKFATPQRVP